MRPDGTARLVHRARARLPWLLAVGAVLVLAGGAYIVWGVGQLRDARSPGDDTGVRAHRVVPVKKLPGVSRVL